MKLISLNTWGGKYFDPLIEFINQSSQDTDIFCFQEIFNTTSNFKQYKDIRANLLNELTKVLPDFQFFYTAEFSGFDATPEPVDFPLTIGKAIFVRENIKVHDSEDVLLFGDRSEKYLEKDFSNFPVSLQTINFTIQGKEFIVINFHGTPFPGTKLDTKLRLEHSRSLMEFLNSKPGAKIVVGDFNLLPTTQSIIMLEEKLKNLIKEFGIQRTRSKLSPFYGQVDFQKFADYTFASGGIKVKSFEVPRIEVSDHLPMVLEFS